MIKGPTITDTYSSVSLKNKKSKADVKLEVTGVRQLPTGVTEYLLKTIGVLKVSHHNKDKVQISSMGSEAYSIQTTLETFQLVLSIEGTEKPIGVDFALSSTPPMSINFESAYYFRTNKKLLCFFASDRDDLHLTLETSVGLHTQIMTQRLATRLPISFQDHQNVVHAVIFDCDFDPTQLTDLKILDTGSNGQLSISKDKIKPVHSILDLNHYFHYFKSITAFNVQQIRKICFELGTSNFGEG